MPQLTVGAPTDVGDALEGAVSHEARRSPLWLRPIEALSALLLINISVLLLVGVVSRYVFSKPIIWSDEVVSLSFIWLTMLGSAIAVHRNEHLRLTLFVDLMPPQLRAFVRAFALVAVAAVLLALIPPAIEYAREEWFIRTPALDLPNTFRVSSIAVGLVLMLALVLLHALRTEGKPELALAVLLVAAVAGLCWYLSPQLVKLGASNIGIFLIGFVAVALVAGVPHPRQGSIK